MHLIQILLPLYDNTGQAIPQQSFAAVRDELVERFGGLTAYTRAPARGLWKEGEDAGVQRDDIVVHEVMAGELDRAWWAQYRASLERRFGQEEIVIRAQRVEVL